MNQAFEPACTPIAPPWEAPQVIPAQIRRVDNLIFRKINQFARENDVEQATPMHGWIIEYLYRHRDEPVFQRDIEREFSITRSTVTNILQLMERKGYIQRLSVPQDARLKQLVLTEEGIQRHEKTLLSFHQTDDYVAGLLTEEEKKSVPAGFETVPAKGLGKDSPYSFRMQVSPYDCLGCGVCLTACPAEGALTMTSFEDMKPEQTLFDEVAMNESYLKKDVINDKSVKNVQFAKPYFQFSAACAGCAETTYIKLLSQLFGDRMYIGNAAGCSSAISGGAPILPYCKDCQGHGPAWEHSLFEDNAEFAYGFFHAQDSIRKELLIRLEAIKAAGIAVEAVEAYENGWKKTETSRAVTDALIAALEQAEQTKDVKYVLENKEYLAKKSVWAVGGDGWAYDIGYGGIDHVMAQNRDVNLMVLDTEVYSNTGGQSSKSTPTSATAKFAASGKRVAKKDLGAMLMQYGYVYVAQVAMGADQAQTLKALREAESYDGPSIVICYCPCLEQHIKAGMGTSQDEMKKAVECGYWHLYRYDPRRIAEGKNPFQLDSKEPDTSKVMDFLMGENRFASLKNNFPDKADALYAKEVEDVKARYAKYKKLAEG